MVDFDVVDLEPPSSPEPGETAPDFTRPLVNTEYWEDASLSDLAADEGRVVLVFTPMVGSFLARYVFDELEERGWADRATVLGVAISTPYDEKRFLEERGYDARLFSDPGNAVAEEYGVAHDLDGMSGISEPRPAVFVLEADLTVADRWAAAEWPAFPDYDALEETLETS